MISEVKITLGDHGYEIRICDDVKKAILDTIVDPSTGNRLLTLSDALRVASFYCADPMAAQWLADARTVGRETRTEMREKLEEQFDREANQLDGSLTLAGLGVPR
jgi:hypothetical protein